MIRQASPEPRPGPQRTTTELTPPADTGPAVTPEPDPWLRTLAAGRAVLVVTRAPDMRPGTGYALDSELTEIGRHPESGIVLSDITVSRRHAEIRRHGKRYILSDAGSLNGTYLNRRPVEHAELADGDEIRIGNYRLTFRPPPAAPPHED